jgi:hypothetical protein
MVPVSFQIVGDGADNRLFPTSWAASYAGSAANALTYIKKQNIFVERQETPVRPMSSDAIALIGLQEE